MKAPHFDNGKRGITETLVAELIFIWLGISNILDFDNVFIAFVCCCCCLLSIVLLKLASNRVFGTLVGDNQFIS